MVKFWFYYGGSGVRKILGEKQMEWQPIATLIAAIMAAGVSSITLWKLQDKKRNDDIDLRAFNHVLDKKFKEFEQDFMENSSYLAEKGKNTATKEDIEQITRNIENIKSEFVNTTEVLKWQLSKRANLHKLQAEKEFEVYTILWDVLTKLRLAFEELRPAYDPQPVGTDWTNLWEKRRKEFMDAHNILLVEIEKHKPFYSNEMYLALRSLFNTSLKEFINFEDSFDGNGKMKRENIKIGQENLSQFRNHLNKTCDLIRLRITES